MFANSAIASLRAAGLRNVTDKILSARLGTSQSKYHPDLKSGRDVFVVGINVEILVAGDKDVT